MCLTRCSLVMEENVRRIADTYTLEMQKHQQCKNIRHAKTVLQCILSCFGKTLGNVDKMNENNLILIQLFYKHTYIYKKN